MADMKQSDYHIHISSQHRWFQLNLKEVWQYRDLIYLFTKRSFVVSYKQTILGPAWIFLTPLFSSIVQAFVFGEIAGIGRHEKLLESCPEYAKLWRAAEGSAAWGVTANAALEGGDIQ